MEREVGAARLWALPAAADTLQQWIRDAGSLHAAASTRAGAGRLEGRGELWDVPSPVADGRWVVRRYRRGGAVASWLGDRYLRGGQPRPLRELAATERARARGVSAPRVVGAAVYPAGPLFYRGELVTERVEGARDLARIVFGRSGYDAPIGEVASPQEREAALRSAGALARALAAAGVWHADLNLKNILLRGSEAWVLDLDRCRLLDEPSDAAGASMLRRLERSLAKWERRTGTWLTPAERGAITGGWAETSSSG